MQRDFQICISVPLSSKEIIFPEPFAFKGFPTNTMTVNPASVSNPESPTIKSMMQSLPSRRVFH